jgi:hypothetical protein
VRLGVVVPMVLLACSGMAPGRRIEGATGGRSSVLARATTAPRRCRAMESAGLGSRASEAAGIARDLKLTLYRPREGVEAAPEEEETASH